MTGASILDGTIAGQECSEFSSAFRQTNAALIRYGEVWLQGASGQELGTRDEREPVPRIPWTGKQLADAWQTHLCVIRLAPKPRIVVQVFYRAQQASYWHELEPDKQRTIEDELCREINARWRSYCATIPQLANTVRGYQVQTIREAAIRALVALAQQVKGGHPCG